MLFSAYALKSLVLQTIQSETCQVLKKRYEQINGCTQPLPVFMGESI